ncbi:MAG: hypothetical protein BMS9Abin29_2192 [Gemmatimonadota bacterium]|nr:MAG: hypothetical protein BMS9Abin29_2192 [Gemmatimonadota bacterium]
MMIDVKPGPRGLAALAVTVLALGPAVASAQGIPEEFSNLKILPDGIRQAELLGIMKGFAIGLGVRCSYCHTVSEGLDSPDDDFSSDDKPTKLKARVMFQMVQAINQDHIANLPDRTEPNVEVGCVTCHGGRTRPTTLVQEMTWAVEEGGVDAMTARYADLRERYFGRGTLDFGVGTLTTVAQRVARSDPEAGMAAVELNLEHYPTSVSNWILKGQLHLLSDETAEAISAFERALELAPGNGRAANLLEQARGG